MYIFSSNTIATFYDFMFVSISIIIFGSACSCDPVCGFVIARDERSSARGLVKLSNSQVPLRKTSGVSTMTKYTVILMMEIWNLSCEFVYFNNRATEARAAVDSSAPAPRTPITWLR
jgi:hypothetical protein